MSSTYGWGRGRPQKNSIKLRFYASIPKTKSYFPKITGGIKNDRRILRKMQGQA
jgi:hypothetical protein